ncbi:RYamide receptor [Folsomia candida]|uniref:Neuropeptide Y receptor n=1 Tax=Folsomia candida TaxID=158441 RepID=A0A226EH36_FOLCA|nr:RYamide receptor [Folsomia candida]OXA56973.1 Neuropeptide Y receptor [Folsomia candida]
MEAEESLSSQFLLNNFTNTSTELLPLTPFTYPPLFQCLIYTLYSAIVITAVFGNILVITVVLTIPKMRTVTNFLIGNLALGDLLMASFSPFGFISILLQFWPFGKLLCLIVTPFQCVFVFVSAWTLVVLSLERWWVIVGKAKWRKGLVFWAIGGVWIFSLVVSLPVGLVVGVRDAGNERMLCEEIGWPSPTLRLSYTLTLIFLQYFLPVSVLASTYTRIAIEIWWKKVIPVLECSGSMYTKSVREERMEKAKRKTISTLLLVVTCYTLSWLPLNLLYLYLEIIQDEESDPFPMIEYVYVLCHWLSMTHSSLNIFIYAFVNERFRDGFLTVLRRCVRSKPQNQAPTADVVSMMTL